MSRPRILLTSDWHLGHPRTPTEDTIADIRKHMLPKIAEADIMFIAGDVFDGMISFNSPAAVIIVDLFVDILHLCYVNNVILRILRGTYSHDILQLRVWNKIFVKSQVPLDYAMIESMSVERISRFDIAVLYVPDNLPYSTKDESLDAMRNLLKANEMGRVDYVVFHGEFDHLNFGFVNTNAYNTKDFNNICKGLILSGHIHRPHQHNNLIYAGSFNRLAHNEEERKGFWMIADDKATFINNPSATVFDTLDYSALTDLNEIIGKHDDYCMKKYSPDRLGYIRIIINDTNLKQALNSFHVSNFPNIRLTFKRLTKQSSSAVADKLRSKKREALEVPSYENIAAIVCRHLTTRGIMIELAIAEEIINGDHM